MAIEWKLYLTFCSICFITQLLINDLSSFIHLSFYILALKVADISYLSPNTSAYISATYPPIPLQEYH